MTWLDQVTTRGEAARLDGRPDKSPLTDLEEKAFDVGIKLGHYRAIRDKEGMGMVPLLVMPRPATRRC